MNSYEQLNDTFNAVASDFEKVTEQISNYKSGIEEIVEKVKQVQKIPMQKNVKNDLPFMKTFSAVQNKFADKCTEWTNKIEQNKINTNFRNKFNNSMLVYIYGKVKSGKSSLGNFIAHGRHNPSEEEIKRSPQVKYDIEVEAFTEDELSAAEQEKLALQRKSTQEQSKFMVDFFEATSCIQYFTRPGLTWIDSPGIHSTTPANGELAKKYLGSADLVVFATTFRSACQDSDRNEILEIFESGKPIVIAVTRSDDEDYDIDDNGNKISTLIMKPNSDREKVKNWCVDSIKETLGEEAWNKYHKQFNNRVITLSCKYAEEHFTDEGLEQSGITEFCETLMDIAQSEGVKIKKNTPLLNVLEHINMIKNGSMELFKDVDTATEELTKLKERIKNKCETISYECAKDIQNEIIPLKNEKYGKDEEYKKAVAEITNKNFQNALEKLAKEILENTSAVLSNMDINEISLPTFKDITTEIKYEERSGSRWGVALGSTVGAGIGFFFGAGIGAGIGATVGSFLGKKLGGNFNSQKSITQKIGDNRDQVQRETIKIIEPIIQKELSAGCDRIIDQGITPLQKWLSSIKNELNACNVYIAEQENSINKELAQ